MVRVAGGATVQQFPGSDVDAKFTIGFEHERSFFLKAHLAVSGIQSVNKVASQLSRIYEWEGRFRVVSAVYRSKSCVLISSKAAGSTIELSGNANALQQLDLGNTLANVLLP